jgi:DNA-3-methyladenine glycosylase I
MEIAVTRCVWAGYHPLCQKYHDQEWGVPLHVDQKLFEFLVLQGMQAGLSWITILKKRDAFRDAFDQFDYNNVAEYGNDKIRELLDNAAIIRNALKINAAVDNARALLRVREEYGTFDEYIWDFVDRKPLQNAWKTFEELPAKTALAETISKDLKRRGFRFVGPTIVYAHMQATGMVNDHTTDCFRHREISNLTSSR